MTRVSFVDFCRDRRANVALTFALMTIPLVFVVGMALDYGAASALRSKLNEAADAAALAGVSATVMQSGGGDAAAITAATNMFNAQINPDRSPTGISLPRLSMDSPVQVTVGHGALGMSVTVNYSAHSQNIFGNILQMKNIGLGGSSTASAATPPNIDFYLLLDTSPSMAIPSTTAGLTNMVSLTSQQTRSGGQGCAFACHMTVSTPSYNNTGNPYVSGNSGPIMDNYAVARANGVVLRMDNVQAAAQQLPGVANTAAKNANSAVKPVYRMSFNTFDADIHFLQKNGVKTGAGASCADTYLTSDLLVRAPQLASSSNIQVLQVYTDHYLTPTNQNNDADTNYDGALKAINCEMPNPGTGISPSPPEEVLFFVTDGMQDELVGSVQTTSTINSSGWCQTIKNRNIQIAILYTTYIPLNVQPYYSNFYMSNIAPFQSNIATALKACASPNLFYQVNVDGDITAALNNLFGQAVNAATAHLTQ
jgi:hypothetical protein